MRRITSFADVEIAIRELIDLRDKFNSRDFVLNGRRVTGAGDAINDQDYITKKQYNDLMKRLDDSDIDLHGLIRALEQRVYKLEHP